MANTWFVMIPPSYQGKSDDEKRLVDFRVQYPYPSQAWTDANAGRVIHGSEGEQGNPQLGGLDLIKWKGPFATEDQAKAAQAPRQQSPNPVNDATNAAQNATGGIGGALASIGDFFSRLTNPHTWLRVAEVVVGAAFLIVGLNALLHNPVGKVAGATPAGRAVKMARL